MEEARFKMNWLLFILAFGVGMLYVYITEPPKKETVKFPTPFNAGSVTYRDTGKNCFVIRAQEVDCNEEGRPHKTQKLQTA